MAISNVTRLALIEDLRARGTVWNGRLDPVEFLSRLYDLDGLPSTDRRFNTAAGDIATHTISFPEDWPYDWVFKDERLDLARDDERLLKFLAEMLHPEVRLSRKESLELAEAINAHLAPDGWQLVEVRQISGRPVFEPRPVGAPLVVPLVTGAHALEQASVTRQIARMNANIETDPEAAIGAAKELLETTCKTVLREFGETIPDELPGLVRRTLDRLGADACGAPDPARAERAIQRLLGALSGIGSAIAEVRNACGTGHGQHATAGILDSTYARLAASASATLVTFIADRYRALRPPSPTSSA